MDIVGNEGRRRQGAQTHRGAIPRRGITVETWTHPPTDYYAMTQQFTASRGADRLPPGLTRIGWEVMELVRQWLGRVAAYVPIAEPVAQDRRRLQCDVNVGSCL